MFVNKCERMTTNMLCSWLAARLQNVAHWKMCERCVSGGAQHFLLALSLTHKHSRFVYCPKTPNIHTQQCSLPSIISFFPFIFRFFNLLNVHFLGANIEGKPIKSRQNQSFLDKQSWEENKATTESVASTEHFGKNCEYLWRSVESSFPFSSSSSSSATLLYCDANGKQILIFPIHTYTHALTHTHMHTFKHIRIRTHNIKETERIAMQTKLSELHILLLLSSFLSSKFRLQTNVEWLRASIE